MYSKKHHELFRLANTFVQCREICQKFRFNNIRHGQSFCLSVGNSRQPWAIFQFPCFGQVDNKEWKKNIVASQYNSLLYGNLFFWFHIKIYMYKVNLKIFWHLARGTLFDGCLRPQFSTHFSIIKMEEMKDYSTQCCSNLWKN